MKTIWIGEEYDEELDWVIKGAFIHQTNAVAWRDEGTVGERPARLIRQVTIKDVNEDD